MLSETTSYIKDSGSPEPYLRKIAEAGFSHVQWGHQWDTDFLYSKSEIDQIRAWLKEFDLQMLTIHGSAGTEKKWDSPREYERLAGVDLVANRLRMASELGAGVVIMHFERLPASLEEQAPYWARMRRSLDALEPVARGCGVKLALENYEDEYYLEHKTFFAAYSPDFLGFCYDAGHGNLGRGEGFQRLEEVKQRLIAVHLHDNDGKEDQHRVPFKGTVDWTRLMQLIASSPYRQGIQLEATHRDYPDFRTEDDFLRAAYLAGQRLTALLEKFL
jgi:sugar phosphate isomerase/epimerase